MRYIALLRGINVSGKNKIEMAKLRQYMEESGFQNVKTYLNSGNVIFDASQDTERLTQLLQNMIMKQFALDIPVYVERQEAVRALVEGAPKWWGTDEKAIYDNLIFILPPKTAEAVCTELGEPKERLEQVCVAVGAIFWSFDRAMYQKTNWWSKTAKEEIGRFLTIRTAGTVRKICEM